MIALAKYQKAAGLDHVHRCVALTAPAYPIALFLARQAGVEVLLEPTPTDLRREIEQADIVQVSFWNNPVLYGFVRQTLPALRLLFWLKIFGHTPPQVITSKLLDFADCCVVTTPGSLELPVFHDKVGTVIEAIADFDRLRDVRPIPHVGFNVGYIGTLNFSKLHPRFIAMSAAAELPDARFIVCGAEHEALLRQAQAIGAEAKFDFRGFVENIRPVLEITDVFGYPLCADTYATSEKSLQEAMWAAIPPVVFPYGGVARHVIQGQTGLVVQTEVDYRAALEQLYRQPDLRRRLGQQAQDYAHANFDGRRTAEQFNAIYKAMMEQPKHVPVWIATEDATPSGWFIDALGTTAAPFIASKTSADTDAAYTADQWIAAALPLLANGEGGIVHYRNAYPEDPWLHYWTALVLIGQQRHEAARRELDAAAHYGLTGVYGRQYIQAMLPVSSS